MIDTITRKPLQVWHGDGPGGTIMVPMDQLDQVTQLLDTNDIFHWVDDEALSVDGEPEVTFITISKKHDPAKVQELLDGVP